MAMLVRTSRKSSLGLKVFLITTVCLIYAVLGASTKNVNITTPTTPQTPVTFESNPLRNPNCTPAAINEFPSDGFTRIQRQRGWIFVHVLLSCYLFALLAVVCDDYFVPAIKRFCDDLHMREDIAGATFMAMASSSPELFVNCVGTFVTQGDIGVGAIVGSAVFNVLAVPACCGLFANMVVFLEWWPISRDSMMYGVSVVLLIVFMQDGRIYLHEALALFSVYIIYILVMCFNTSLMTCAHRLVYRCHRKGHYVEYLSEATPLLGNEAKFNGGVNQILETEVTLKDCEELGGDNTTRTESTKIWEWPKDKDTRGKLWWILTWPISFCLKMTTPDCRKYPRLYVITFVMCIFWIGITTYLISWLITVIGDTLNIPDSVMGLTFLAAGMSVPEAVSSVIVTNQGHGSMGLSSSIGSNTFDILLCLGLPWLIKTAYNANSPGNWIRINSSGLNYSAISLLSTLVLLYLSIALNHFRLDRKVGTICLLMYIAFLIMASLIELNVFSQVNLPTCDR